MNLLYIWTILGIVLLIAETFLPGFSLFWIAIGAFITALTIYLYPAFSDPVTQLIFFLAAASLMVALGYVFGHFASKADSDASSLNRRADQHIGKIYKLETKIENGSGRALVGDSSWMVEGPSLEEGTAVKVVGTNGTVLIVEPLKDSESQTTRS